MARKNRSTVGGTSIEVSDLMDRMVDQVRQGAAGAVLLAMEEFQNELMESAIEVWPVGKDRKAESGEPVGPGRGSDIKRPRAHSIDLFETVTSITDTGVLVQVRNTAGWAWAIRFGQSAKKGQKKGRKAWNEIVMKPGTKGSRKVADIMQDKILELARRSME